MILFLLLLAFNASIYAMDIQSGGYYFDSIADFLLSVPIPDANVVDNTPFNRVEDVQSFFDESTSQSQNSSLHPSFNEPYQINEKNNATETSKSRIRATKIQLSARKCHYQCQICNKISQTFSSASNHFKINHHKANYTVIDSFNLPVGQHFECNFPSCKANILYEELRSHKIKEHTIEKSCSYPDCGKSFISEGSLRSHIDRIHNNFLYPCNGCKHVSSSLSKLHQHMKNHLLIKCLRCQKEIKTTNMARHLQTHNVSPRDSKQEQRKICVKQQAIQYSLIMDKLSNLNQTQQCDSKQ